MRVVNRRHFFRHLLSIAIEVIEEAHGRPQMRLSDITLLPDAAMRDMVPVLSGFDSHFIEGARIMNKERQTGRIRELYVLRPQEQYILAFFDGRHTINEISNILMENEGLPDNDAFQRVKNLFIVLTRNMICQPLHAHERINDEQQTED